MMRPFAVDANAIALFQLERVKQTKGVAHSALERITAENCIALDIEKLCLQEWMNAAKGTFPFALADWIVDMLAVGKIRYYSLAPNTCRKKLLEYGLPKDDHKWIRLALGSNGKILVTEDVDFFDPTLKKANSSAKEKILEAGKGPCSKSLMKDFGVEVVHIGKVGEFFH